MVTMSYRETSGEGEARVKDSTHGGRTDPERTRGDRSTVWSDEGGADLEVQPLHSRIRHNGGP